MIWIIATIIIWIIIYVVVLKVAFLIIELDRKSDKKRFNCELEDYDFEKKLVILKVTAFFVLIPVGFICMYFIT